MRLVIDIPEEMYKEYVSVNLGRGNGKTITDNLLKAIKNGTPLPKRHSDLIDRMTLSDHIKNRMIQTAMNNMETILPYSKVCTDIVDNRIDTWIDEVKTIIEGSENE